MSSKSVRRLRDDIRSWTLRGEVSYDKLIQLNRTKRAAVEVLFKVFCVIASLIAFLTLCCWLVCCVDRLRPLSIARAD